LRDRFVGGADDRPSAANWADRRAGSNHHLYARGELAEVDRGVGHVITESPICRETETLLKFMSEIGKFTAERALPPGRANQKRRAEFATSIVTAIGRGAEFKNGRHLAAGCGLLPRLFLERVTHQR
jgi:hypothetical protein